MIYDFEETSRIPKDKDVLFGLLIMSELENEDCPDDDDDDDYDCCDDDDDDTD